MLSALRNIQNSFFIKILLGLTALSFMSLFGISGYLGPNQNRDVAITVGKHVTPMRSLQKELDREVKRIGAIYGDNENIERALRAGLLGNIVQRATSRAILDATADDMDISISDETLREYIMQQDEFKDESGKFNRQIFNSILQMSNISENEYLSILRGDIKRNHLLSLANKGNHVPEIMVRNIYLQRNEKRVAEFAKLKISDLASPKAPEGKELEAYYESNKMRYIAPEYRNVTAIFLNAEAVLGQIAIDEKTIKAAYEADISLYSTPEKRKISQMRFDDEEKAKEALAKVNAGEDFNQVAKDIAAQTAEDTDLGWNTKDTLLSEINEDVFNAPKGGVVGPVKSQFGWHVMKVEEIEKGDVTPYEKVKDEIVAKFKNEQAYDKIYNISTKLDDALGRGTSIEDAAKQLGLKTETFELDPEGKDTKGKQVKEGLINQLVIDRIFEARPDISSPLIENNNGYVVFRLDSITDPEPRALKDVKKDLIERWQGEKQATAAKDKADKLLAEIKSGKSLKDVAAKNNLKLEKTEAITRFETVKLPPEAVAQLFRLKSGETEMVKNQEGYIFISLKDVIAANPDNDKAGLDRVRAYVGEQIAADLGSGLIAALSARQKVKINEEAIKEALAP